MNPYETDKLLGEYLLFHYGTAEEVLPWKSGPADALDYPVRCVSECVELSSLPPQGRALDVGCAVGRATFELARHFPEVIGIDYSRRFVEVAAALARDGNFPYERTEEGALTTRMVASLPSEIARERARFEHGDAQDLRKDIGSFDVVLAANLVDRLAEPMRFLGRCPALVKSGGQLVIASPYTWLPEFTAPERWLGGIIAEGTPLNTLQGLTAALSEHFALVGTKDLPFLIREHARKYQWSVAQASIWRRK